MKKAFAVGLCLLGAGLLAGCENAARPPAAPPPVGVAVSPSTSQTIDQGQTAPTAFMATVSNDSASKGVTWSVSCSQANCGSVSPTSTASGGSTTYMAPAAVSDPSGKLTVTVTAKSVSDTTKTGSGTVVVSVPPQLPSTSSIQTALNTANPNPMTGTPFSFQFTLMAGNPGAGTITWSPASGVGTGLAGSGLTLSPSGLLSGIPKLTKSGQFRTGFVTSPTPFTFGVTATDSGTPSMRVTSGTLSITVSPSNITVTITSPTSPPTIQQGQTVSITATVAMDPANQGVTWMVSCAVSSCGSVSPTSTPSGTPTTYTAPTPVSANLAVTVTATSVGDTSKTAFITVTVTPPPISVTLSPSTPQTIAQGATLQITATVANDPAHGGVTWSATCSTSPCGSFNPTSTASGSPTTYTAPASVSANLTVTVTATSASDMTKSASLMVTVAPLMVSVSPPMASVVVNGTQQFTPTVTNDPANNGVTWTLTQSGTACASTCGTIAPASTKSGTATTYTAPATVPANPTVTITATSVTDSTKSNSATITVTAAPPISVSVAPPTASVTVTATAQFTPTVTNDSANNGVTWTLTQSGTACSPTCGSVSPTSTASGAPTTYTAPSSVPTPATVTLTATSVTDTTKSATATITVAALTACTPSQTTLCGRFTFGFQGADANGPVAMAGSILTDGTNVVSGEIDMNHVAPTTLGNFNFLHGTINASPASSFSFDPTTKLGTLTLNISHGTLTLTRTFALALAPDRPEGRLIAFDPAGTSGILGSGAIGAPDSTAFNAAAIKGNYALSFIGGDGLSHRVGMLAIFNADGSGNLTTANNNSVTVNVGGTVGTGLNFGSGAGYGQIDPTTGRGFAGFTITGAGDPLPPSGLNFFFHILSANKLFFIGAQPPVTPGSAEPILSGFAVSQAAGPFSNASVTCGIAPNLPCVFASFSPGSASIGLATVNPPGMMTFLIDANVSGTIVQNTTVSGLTYTVQAAGNGTIVPPSGSLIIRKPIDFVIIGDRRAFILDEGTDVDSGLVEPQLATALTNLNFVGVSQATTPVPSTMAVAFATFSSSTGPGTVSGVADANGGTPVSGATFTASYDPIAANGRGTGTATLPGIATFTFYVVKGGRLVLIGQTSGSGAALLEFGHHGGDILP